MSLVFIYLKECRPTNNILIQIWLIVKFIVPIKLKLSKFLNYTVEIEIRVNKQLKLLITTSTIKTSNTVKLKLSRCNV